MSSQKRSLSQNTHLAEHRWPKRKNTEKRRVECVTKMRGDKQNMHMKKGALWSAEVLIRKMKTVYILPPRHE